MLRLALVSVVFEDVAIFSEVFQFAIGFFDLRKEVCVDVLG